MDEMWKDISGTNGLYRVSNKGRVESVSRRVKNAKNYYYTKTRILKDKDDRGYRKVHIRKDGATVTCLVHILVANAFMGERPGNSDVMHLDGNGSNNCVENLRYGLRKCNMAFAVDHGTYSPPPKKVKYKYKSLGLQNAPGVWACR